MTMFKPYFGMTREQFQAWLEKYDEPECGILACSPEIYEEMMRKNAEAIEAEIMGVPKIKKDAA